MRKEVAAEGCEGLLMAAICPDKIQKL